MKVLHFFVAARHPSVALPLMSQAGDVLRPFNRFLAQAIHTAKQRQTRYQLPWARVRDLLAIRIEPMDSVLRVRRRRPGVVLTDWPATKAPDLSQSGFVAERGEAVRFESATQTADGLVVQTEPPLHLSDRVLWCMVESGVRSEAQPSPPSAVTDTRSNVLRLIGTPTPLSDERYWRLIVEGRHGDCDLIVDGEEVEAEALSCLDDLDRVVDTSGRSFDVRDGAIRVDEPPAEGPLRGDNGLRYQWRQDGRDGGRRGCWVQLLPPETSEADEFLDPRAAFCEGDVEAVWTQKYFSKETSFKVKKVDPDRYQLLLDRYPDEGSTLFLPLDLHNLYLQRRALRQLCEAPLPHHQGLLRLCEDPMKVDWPRVTPMDVPDDGWRALTDPSRDGTEEQRRFVTKALGSRDFAFLEGPPGSGKTTAICEIVQQLVAKGERVLLCASTHVAIDNVLERLLESDAPIDAVRIGKLDKVDDKVQRTQLDARIDALVGAWRKQPSLQKYSDVELGKMAERTIIMAANLTCGTTMGIVNHPLFRDQSEELHRSERPITTMPHWDVLIIDEASKTLIQEFMVPALMAKKWIIVGDVRQLPPFADRADIVANLRDLVDENGKPVFPADHQRACLLLFRLSRRDVRQPGLRWLIVERPGVLEWIARELEAYGVPDLSIVRVASRVPQRMGAIDVVTTAQLRAGQAEALRVAAADWVLVDDQSIADVGSLLPANLLIAEDVTGTSGRLSEGSTLLMRQAWWLQRAGRAGALVTPYRDRDFKFDTKRDEVTSFVDAQLCERGWLRKHDLAQELAWRLTRCHELKHSRNDRERERLRHELSQLMPAAAQIEEPLTEIEDIGLPSILEVLQEGIGVDRAKRRSSLTAGLRATRPQDFEARFETLTYQHRMNADIAAFPREVIYQGQALRDANTIGTRDQTLGWDFGSFPSRRIWADIDGRDQAGVNLDEIRAMRRVLEQFIEWARQKGRPPRGLPQVWEVACLCFYVKQERAISEMLQEVTQDNRKTRFSVRDAPVEIVCATVDRFQGREADFVALSMRNTRRVGFLDSPNRLNVAVTRARQQLVILGHHRFFSRCGVSELQELARRTQMVESSGLFHSPRRPR
jgi:hypothetical protein